MDITTGNNTGTVKDAYVTTMRVMNLAHEAAFVDSYDSIIKHGIVIKEEMRLSATDLRDLDYSKPIFLARYNSYFVIKSISVKAGDAAKVELIKINPHDFDDRGQLFDAYLVWEKDGGAIEQHVELNGRYCAELLGDNVCLEIRRANVYGRLGLCKEPAYRSLFAVIQENTTFDISNVHGLYGAPGLDEVIERIPLTEYGLAGYWIGVDTGDDKEQTEILTFYYYDTEENYDNVSVLRLTVSLDNIKAKVSSGDVVEAHAGAFRPLEVTIDENGLRPNSAAEGEAVGEIQDMGTVSVMGQIEGAWQDTIRAVKVTSRITAKYDTGDVVVGMSRGGEEEYIVSRSANGDGSYHFYVYTKMSVPTQTCDLVNEIEVFYWQGDELKSVKYYDTMHFIKLNK